MKTVLELQDVHKIYRVGEIDVPALRGVDLTVREGEFLAILGKSGSGKSTLLNSVGCLDKPTKGRILLEGKDIESLKESDLAQIRGKKIGFIFQNFNLIRSLSALENVMLPMVFQRAYGQMEMAVGKLSGGEQQRVAIARSLSNDPKIILADEPTGNLDSKTEEEIISILSGLHEKEGKTIIMITHNQKLAQYAQRVIHLVDGRIRS